MQGFSDQAMRIAEESIEEAQATGHDLSVCHALVVGACQIALWVGNLDVAARYVRLLLEYSRKHGLPLAHAFGARLYQIVVLKGGDLDMGSQLSPTGAEELVEIVESNSSFRIVTGLSDLGEGLGQTGRLAEAFALVETEI
jgi:hypothetical protein